MTPQVLGSVKRLLCEVSHPQTAKGIHFLSTHVLRRRRQYNTPIKASPASIARLPGSGILATRNPILLSSTPG